MNAASDLPTGDEGYIGIDARRTDTGKRHMPENKKVPNNLMHFILTRLEDIVGWDGTNAILKYAGADRFICNYPPNDFNMVESMDTFYAIAYALMDLYGENGYLALLRGVGVQTFSAMIRELPWFFEVEDGAMDGLLPKEQFKLMYRTYFDKWTNTVGIDSTLEFLDDRIIDTSPECTNCRGLTSTKPICIHIVDFYRGMAKHVGLADVKIEEVRCKAMGDDVCQFVTTLL
jgi:predicted hydrocarbon binding protein